MKSIIVFVLCASIAVSAAFVFKNSNEDESCNCLPLSRCFPDLLQRNLNVYKNSKSYEIFAKYIGDIKCGYGEDSATMLVCCPSEMPAEVLQIVDSKKYWPTYSEKQKSIKKLEYANQMAKKSQFLAKKSQFPGCGVSLWREEFDNTPDIGDNPWLALLEYNTPGNIKKFLCGGVLISDQHILTAARCVTTQGNTLTKVVLGEYDTNTNLDCNGSSCMNSVRRYDIERTIVHEKYNDGISPRFFMDVPESHDIALIKLKGKVQLNEYIYPICLPLKKPAYRKFRVSGWGKSLVPRNKGFNRILMSYLWRCTPEQSNRYELSQIYDENEHICAAPMKPTEHPCIGDSGGPLISKELKEEHYAEKWTVFGISFMEMTCENHGQSKDLPGIYTNVYNYKDWIIEHMLNS